MSARFLKVAISLAALLALGAVLSCDFFVDANAIASIAVSPANATIALNASSGAKNTQQFTATATLGNQTQQDVTGASTWASSSPNVATISNTGLATASSTNTGVANITASFQGATSSNFPVTVQ